jgi:hypothetical protein
MSDDVGLAPMPYQVPAPARRLFIAVALLTFAVYLVSARGLPQTFDEQIVLDTTTSLAHREAKVHTQLLYTGAGPGLSVLRHNGARVGIYGLGTSIVSLPFYAAGQVAARVSPPEKRVRVVATAMMYTNALITAATVLLLMLVCFLLGAPPPGAVLVGLAYGLGSYAYPHALTMFTEPGTAMCVIAAVLFAIRASRSGRRSDLAWCGAMAAFALLFRISAALFLPIFGVWLLVAGARARDLRQSVRFGAWFTAGAVAPLILLLAVNGWRYGNPWNFGYTLSKAGHQSYPIVRGIAGQWLSSGKSLFLYAPIALVALVGLGRSLRKVPLEMCLLGAIVAANTLFFARVQFWSGDWAWGPRYLQIVLPCVAAMAAPLMEAQFWRRAVLVVGVLGFLFAALPAVLVRFTFLFYEAYRAMPPPSGRGPRVWDHSYYALVWHTLHFQPILYQLRHLPDAFSNSFDYVTTRVGPPGPTRFPGQPRLELWWLRVRDIGTAAALFFALLPATVAFVGVRMLRRYRRSQRELTTELPPDVTTELTGDLPPA